jgi:hypothetical protein
MAKKKNSQGKSIPISDNKKKTTWRKRSFPAHFYGKDKKYHGGFALGDKDDLF